MFSFIYCRFTCYSKDITKIKEYVGNNEIILILNKKDVLPYKIKDEKLISYFKNYNIFKDIIVISANKTII